ncbi:WD-40 repeat-containing protein [Coprinopsis marcescibilis]|uniref:methylated diphthine methylhydrolase n=1 Tax=Coprinopsis marcescibilis TaxID=230819 RepID=A0A5C3LP05_COPMA|nr:WD-40 repeat-containing protein [Coprinopsis marcescibilis]
MVCSYDTQYAADSIEFCPALGSTDVFVCGTYELVKDTPHPQGHAGPKAYRKGQCLVFRINEVEPDHIDQVQELDFPAIPDMKWCHGNHFPSPVLAIADSEGSITLLQLDQDTANLKQINSTRCEDISTLCLSLDWNNRIGTTTQPLGLAVSSSNGNISYIQVDDTGSMRIVNQWHAHDYEPWITAWDYHDPNMLFSGGDDLTMKLWDIRSGFEQPSLTNKRFDAGVTTIQSHFHIPHLVSVGSYDEKVRFFDTRNLQRPIAELDVGGGVWRVKWHPSIERQHDMVIACMHDGFKVGQYSNDSQPQIISEFREHESLAYGVDWSFSTNPWANGSTTIASCSFYDHSLRVWSA